MPLLLKTAVGNARSTFTANVSDSSFASTTSMKNFSLKFPVELITESCNFINDRLF